MKTMGKVRLMAYAVVTLFAASVWGAKVGVFVGDGVQGVGPARWLQVLGGVSELTVTGVDGAAIRAGALNDMALLVLPDGDAARQAAALGPEGGAKLKAFISNGGACIGSAAGARLLIQGGVGLGLVPWTTQKEPPRNGTQLSTRFTSRAKELLGVGAGSRRVWYNCGPNLVAGTPVPEAQVESVATFVGNINPVDPGPAPTMTGTSCLLVGTYGKGRLAVVADNPEYNVQTFDIVQGVLSYVLKTPLTLKKTAQRRRGQLSAGFFCDGAWSGETVKQFLELLASGVADVEILDQGRVDEGLLRHQDALVVPAGATVKGPQFAEFTARGGKVLAPSAAVAALRAAAPANERIVRAAVYADWGVSCAECWNITKLLACSPRYDVTFVDRNDIAKNVVNAKDFDLLLMCGGPIGVQERVVGAEGRAAVTNFVRQGGAYYGICAGTFSALQTANAKRPRFALVPFVNMPNQPYRGWCEMNVRFTKDAKEMLGYEPDSLRQILYWGGPVMVPDAVPADSDLRVLAYYHGHVVNTFAGGDIRPMSGAAAIVGGRFGKGKVLTCAIHPECSESTRDLPKSFLKYLTGCPAEPVYPVHKPGALKVAYCMETATKDGFAFGMSMVKDPRFDVRPVTPYEVNQGLLDHIDVLFFPFPEPGGYMRLVHDFIRQGGRVIELDPENKGSEKGPNVFHVKTLDEARRIMLCE